LAALSKVFYIKITIKLTIILKGFIACGGNFVSLVQKSEGAWVASQTTTVNEVLLGGQGAIISRFAFSFFSFSFLSYFHIFKINSISVSPMETNIVVVSNFGQMVTLSLNSEGSTVVMGSAQLWKPDIFSSSKGFHNGSVTGLDVAVRKPLVVSCGSDRTVRVWNYVSKKCVLVKSFKEELTRLRLFLLSFIIKYSFFFSVLQFILLEIVWQYVHQIDYDSVLCLLMIFLLLPAINTKVAKMQCSAMVDICVLFQ